MHRSSMDMMEDMINKYASDKVNVLDVGSIAINKKTATYKEIFDTDKVKYTGMDLSKGRNVDLIMEEPYKFPSKDESFDLVISGQAFEHIEFFWLTFLEMVRVCEKDGIIIVIAPSKGKYHRYPVDCWRFYLDSWNALAKWAGHNGMEVELLQKACKYKDEKNQWGDSVGVFKRI